MANIDNYTIKTGWGTQFKAAAKFPVIADRIFATLAEVQAYITSTAADASAIPGLVLSVIEDGANNGAYLVTGTDGNLSLSKLADTASAGEDNVINEIKVNDVTITPDEKVVNIPVPTKVSQLTNDKNFATTSGAAITIVKEGNNYIFSQGTEQLATKIEIPKDLVVSSGEIVTDPEGLEAGKYLKLTLNSETSEPIFINVADLVDVYKAGADATEVQLVVSSDNTITATIVNGAVSAEKIADNAVTTLKIENGAVTNDKLAQSVKDAITDAANSAPVKEVKVNGSSITPDANKAVNITIAESAADGKIKVNDVDVAIHGLKSAAYKEEDDFEAAGAANTVKAELLGTESDDKTKNTIYGVKEYAEDVATTAAAAVVGLSTDTKDSDTVKGAKKYTDNAVSTLETSITTLETNINTSITAVSNRLGWEELN